MLSFPLLGRSRSWAAVCLFSLLSLSVLLAPSVVQAQGGYPGGGSGGSYPGSYGGPTYSGGTVVLTHAGLPTTTNYSNNNDGSYGGGYYCGAGSGPSGTPDSASVYCSGAITATFNWNNGGDPNNLPPKCVIVTEHCTVTWSGQISGGATVDGGCTNPLGGSSVPATPGPGATWDYTRYTVRTDSPATLTLSCDADADAEAASGSVPNASSTGSANVNYSASVSPVTLNLAGPTPDSSGNLNILVGQHCSTSLPGLPIPSGSSVLYQWSVSGSTFQSWSADTPANGSNPYNPDASYYDDGPGPLSNPTAGWYWNDRSQTPTPETVSCTATVTPPAEQGSAFTVSMTKNVLVYRPNWTATGVGGYVAIRLVSGTTYEIVATSTSAQLANGLKGGMNFTATVSSPNTSLFGDGSIQLAQLCTPNRSFTSANGDYTYSQNGQEGIDGGYPYGWNIGGPTYQTDDLPGSALPDYSVANFTMQDQFKDFIMYYPPGSVQCVPLAQFIWSTNGYAVLPHTGTWSSYVTQNGSDNAGTVSPSGNTATFLLSNIFPEWTQITGTGTFGLTSPIQGETFRRSSISIIKRRHDSSTTQRSMSHQEATMDKWTDKNAPSAPFSKIEGAQDQHPISTAHFGRRSGPDPKQQAKNDECYALDMAGFEALRTGQYSDAEAYARQALTLTHGYDPLAPELLALALDAQDKTAEALHAYKVLADQGGDFPRIMIPYARLLLQSGHWAQAAAAYNKALPDLGNIIQANSHFSSNVPQPRELAVAIHIAQGLTYGVATWGGHMRQEEAMKEFDTALRLAPASPLANYYYGYGWKHLNLKSRTRAANAQRAKAAFQKAAALGDADVKKSAGEALKDIK